MVVMMGIVHCFRIEPLDGSSAIKKQSDYENKGEWVPDDGRSIAQPDQPEQHSEIDNPAEH